MPRSQDSLREEGEKMRDLMLHIVLGVVMAAICVLMLMIPFFTVLAVLEFFF